MITCALELFFTTVVAITMLNTSQNNPPLSLIKFTGDDASTFLQGQLTNDINALKDTWQYSGYCSPKGRLLALLQLWKHDDELYGLLPSSLVESTIKRLRMYVMRSKVTIEVVESTSISSNISSTEPRYKYQSSNTEHILSFGGRDLIISTTAADSDDQNNAVSDDWLSSNILDGLPEISDKTAELFVPQMVNLDLLNGINFKKGCYTGQEIVARMHYLGKLKQRMFVCRVIAPPSTLDENAGAQVLNTNLLIGAKVMLADKSVGHIVSSDGKLALAVLRTEFAQQKEGEPMIIANSTGKTIGLRVNDTQPYSLELTETK